MENQPTTPDIDPVAIAQRLSIDHATKAQEDAVRGRVDVTNPVAIEEYSLLHDKLGLMEGAGYEPLSFLNPSYPNEADSQKLPSPSEILTAKQQAAENKDRTKQLDLRDRPRNIDVLADSLKAHPQTRRNLVELRNKAVELSDLDSLFAIDNALIDKLALSKSTPDVQQAAIEKLNRLFGAKKQQEARTEVKVALAEVEPGSVKISSKSESNPSESVDSPLVASENSVPTVVVNNVAVTAETSATDIHGVVPIAAVEEQPTTEIAETSVNEAPSETSEDSSSEALEIIPADSEQLKGFKFDVGVSEKALKGEDFIVCDDSLGLFAVIDGMGGHGGGDVAAQTIGKALSEYFEKEAEQSTIDENNAVKVMKEAFLRAQADVASAAFNGLGNYDMGAVATAVKAFKGKGGKNLAVYGHVGDTRLYLLDTDNVITQVTKDEGHLHKVFNSISADREVKTDQFGIIEIPVGSRLLLISDGISGDRGSDIMSLDEIRGGLIQGDPQEAAEALLEASRKEDDKSVLVIDIERTDSPDKNDEDNISEESAKDTSKTAKRIGKLLSNLRRGRSAQMSAQTELSGIDPKEVFEIPSKEDDSENGEDAISMLKKYAALHGASEAIKIMKPEDTKESIEPRTADTPEAKAPSITSTRIRRAGQMGVAHTVIFRSNQTAPPIEELEAKKAA
ncbi:protein serine/threonine phosphatase 2C family protein [Polaromonas sp.]|nr:protein serine/threonine phosphatase 2C family protein [Candidatus Saccharibacteria bacterium]